MIPKITTRWKTQERFFLVLASRASIAYFTFRITKNFLSFKKKKERKKVYAAFGNNFGADLTASILNVRIRVFLCFSFWNFLKLTKESARIAHLCEVEAQKRWSDAMMMMMMRSESLTTPNPNLNPKPDKRMTGSNLFTLLLLLVLRLGFAEHVSGTRSVDSKLFQFNALTFQRFPELHPDLILV